MIKKDFKARINSFSKKSVKKMPNNEKKWKKKKKLKKKNWIGRNKSRFHSWEKTAVNKIVENEILYGKYNLSNYIYCLVRILEASIFI